jgi:hypothetical protein
MTTDKKLISSDIALSNSLTDLAARIKAEHEAIKVSLRESVQHAFAAGELLIEAKKQLKHGQWLPWLRDRCTISERTAQLYMRCAKSRAEIEKSAMGVADLTLTEAAAMLMMSSNVKKLFEYIKKVEHLSDPEEIMQVALDSGVATFAGTIDYESSHTVEEGWARKAIRTVADSPVGFRKCPTRPKSDGLNFSPKPKISREPKSTKPLAKRTLTRKPKPLWRSPRKSLAKRRSHRNEGQMRNAHCVFDREMRGSTPPPETRTTDRPNVSKPYPIR